MLSIIIPDMLKKLSEESKFKIYLALLSLVGLGFILMVTHKYGAGVSSDAARNLSTAESLLQGKGFVDMLGGPFVLWPPLYPLLLAGLSWLTRWSAFQAGWVLNVILYPLNLWLCGWLFYLIFKEKSLYAFIASLALLFSRSTLRIYANVASEPLFVTFMLIFFCAAAQYFKNDSHSMLWLMFVSAGLATLQRYLGVILIGVGGLVVLFKDGWRGLPRAILPALTAALPIALWGVFHNLPLSGGLFGPRNFGAMYPLENINLSLTKILWWFMPLTPPLDQVMMRPWILIGAFVLLLIIINKRVHWMNWLKSMANGYVWPALIFSVVYFFTLAVTVVTADHLDLTSDRYYVVILPAVLILLFITLDQLVFSHFDFKKPFSTYALAFLILLYFIYPVYSMQGYLREALVLGEPSNYNIANSVDFRTRTVTIEGQKILGNQPTVMLYTNYVNIVWFLFHGHPVQELPFVNPKLSASERAASLRQDDPNWPPQSGYILWYEPNEYHNIASPDDLSAVANLKVLYEGKTGGVYYVQAP
ncbi:MAG: hypothetical protein WCA79_17880 [Anaerolineales bacterium]